MKIIGLTGPTGAGKSTVAEQAKKLGYQVIDCDEVVRREQSENKKLLAAVEEAFPNTVIGGVLDRHALADVAFSSPENTEKLNKTVLPFITEKIEEMIDGEIVLLDAPTLFESGIYKKCDKIISVLADKSIRKRRITERDSLDENSADKRLSAAKSDVFFTEKSDKIIQNDGDLQTLITRANEVLSEIKTEVLQ